MSCQGKQPKDQGIGDVCGCEHAGTAQAWEAITLVLKSFGNGKLARFADEKKIGFAVRSLQNACKKIPQKKNQTQTKPQHHVFSRPNPQHAQFEPRWAVVGMWAPRARRAQASPAVAVQCSSRCLITPLLRGCKLSELYS